MSNKFQNSVESILFNLSEVQHFYCVMGRNLSTAEFKTQSTHVLYGSALLPLQKNKTGLPISDNPVVSDYNVIVLRCNAIFTSSFKGNVKLIRYFVML